MRPTRVRFWRWLLDDALPALALMSGEVWVPDYRDAARPPNLDSQRDELLTVVLYEELRWRRILRNEQATKGRLRRRNR